MPHLFSVIIPTYNRAEDVVHCVNSLLSQNFNNAEIIVVDDGSTDSTLTDLTLISAKYPQLKLLPLEKNQGVNFARNRAIEAATGEFLFFLDSDDYLTSDALSVAETNVLANKDKYSHFLFTVSDREQDPTLPKQEHIYYSQWLSGEVTGDFTHIIKADYFINNLFFEQFKAFPALNWFRIFKRSSPQLFINKTLCIRDRNRIDSIGYTMFLVNKHRIKTQFDANNILIDLYGDDFKAFAPDGYNNLLTKNILLGIAIGERDKVASYFKKLPTRGVKYYISKAFFGLHLSFFVRNAIYLKTNFKRLSSNIH